MEATRGGYKISTDPSQLDRNLIHEFLASSYWAAGIPRAVVDRSIENSLAFGVYGPGGQVGFARVITDRATYAYLADVFVVDAHRGKGLGKWLMEVIRSHPDLQGLKRFVLVTRDAHGLYADYGFTPLAHPERSLEAFDPEIYTRKRP